MEPPKNAKLTPFDHARENKTIIQKRKYAKNNKSFIHPTLQKIINNHETTIKEIKTRVYAHPLKPSSYSCQNEVPALTLSDVRSSRSVNESSISLIKNIKVTGGIEKKFISRDPKYSLIKLLQNYQPYIHKRNIHNPSYDDVPPPIISREEAFRFLESIKKNEILIGITQIVELRDECWLFGVTPQMITIALEIKEFYPFFYISCPTTCVTIKDAQKLQYFLNAEENQPIYHKKRKFTNSNGGNNNPVHKIEIEYRLKGVKFDGRIEFPYYKIYFQNMSAYRYYREKLSMGEYAQQLKYQPQLFHEEQSISQMLFNTHVELNLFKWVSIPYEKIANYIKEEDMYDELRRLQIMDQELIEEDDNGGGEELRLEDPKIIYKFPKTKTCVESKCNLMDLEPINSEEIIPILLATFDIETLTYDVAEYQRTLKTVPEFNDGVDEIYGGEHKEKKDNTKPKDTTTQDIPSHLKGVYPKAQKPKDAVILIATQFMVYGDKHSNYYGSIYKQFSSVIQDIIDHYMDCPQPSFLRVIHCLGKPKFESYDLPHTLVYTFDEKKEADMLEHWSNMIRVFDVEWLAGYNSIKYDLPYLFQRAKLLESQQTIWNLSRFECLPHERIKNSFRYKDCMAREKMTGKNHSLDGLPIIDTPGMIQFDALPVVKQLERNMDMYTLKEVAKKLLKGKLKKIDMPYELISPFWAVGGSHLRRLVVYCEYDVMVTQAVMNVRFLVGHTIEISKVTKTSVYAQMMQGQQIRTMNDK